MYNYFYRLPGEIRTHELSGLQPSTLDHSDTGSYAERGGIDPLTVSRPPV